MTQSVYDLFSTDQDLEVKGKWLDYGAAGRYLLARAGGANKRFLRLLEAALRPYRNQIKNGVMDEKEADRILAGVFADSVILNWEGVSNRAGEAVPYSRENVITLLLDVPEFFREIQTQASEARLFRPDNVEDDLKN